MIICVIYRGVMMEADMERKKLKNIEYLSDRHLEALEIFADKVAERYGKLLGSCIVMRPGNDSSKEGAGTKDLKVFFLIDDLNSVVLNPALTDIRGGADELAYESDLPLRCEVLLASVFWEKYNDSDLETLDMLRHGIVIKDNGFARPLQDMLVTGKVRPTDESMKVYFVKAERSLKISGQKVNRAVLDLYWAVIDSAHAAVMVAGMTPPSPEHLAEAVKSELVKRNLVHRRCGDIVDKFYNIAKRIMHKEVFEVSGREFDSYLDDADFFIKEIDDFVRSHIDRGRIDRGR